VKDAQGKVFKPINEIVELDGKKLYQRDISFISIDLATKLTYRDCRREGNLFLRDFPSPRTVCRRTHDSLPLDREDVRTKANVIQADGTKAHGNGRENDVNVVIGIGENTKRCFWPAGSIGSGRR
jgi:hypothetical protein